LPQPLEARQLRFHRDARLSGGLDQAAALLVDRDRRALRGIPQVALGRRLRGQGAGVRVQPQADLAATLLDERRQAIGEGARPVSRRL
jgi:hypothetical protein